MSELHYTGELTSGERFTGAELMTLGLCCPLGPGDAAPLIYTLEA